MAVDLTTDDLGATNAALPKRIGPFAIKQRIGRGGMGVVFEAYTDAGQRVALKLIRPAGSAEDQEILVTRLLREAAAIARIDHPGVVRLVRYGNAGGAVYLAMDYITGVTLKDIQRRTSVDAVTLLSLATQILETLHHLHGQGIIHRDIKPDNLLITDEGRTVLADFGIAWLDDIHGITRPGEVIGSVGYLAPECIEGDPPTPASDIYALGRTLFEMAALVPRARLDPNTPILEKFALRMEVDWQRFPTAAPWPAVRNVIRRMIAHRVRDRFETAAECSLAFRDLTKLVRPGMAGAVGRPRDLNEIGDDFTCFEPAATLSAFVDHLALPSRSPWTAMPDTDDLEFEDDDALDTIVPEANPVFAEELIDTDQYEAASLRPDAGYEADDATERSKAWGPETPMPVAVQEATPRPQATPRLPPARRALDVTGPTVPPTPNPPPRSPVLIPALPRRRVWPAVLLGLFFGLAVGGLSAWLVQRETVMTPSAAPDEPAARAALTRAITRLEKRDFGGARVELERCVALADLDDCHRRLAILLALRGDPAAQRHRR